MKKEAFFVLIFAMLALPVLAQTTTCTPPVGAELEKFPLKVGKLSTADMAVMGLSPKKLDKPVVVYNHHRNIRGGCWELNTLSAGTIVLVDMNGSLRYKDDCGNRVAEVESRPQPEKVLQAFDPGSVKNSLGKKLNSSPTSRGPGAWSNFWNNAGKAWTTGWGALGSLFGFLLPLLGLLLLLAVIAGVVFGIMQAIRNWRQAQNPPPPPAPVPTAPVPPTPPVQQAGVNPPVPPPPIQPAPPAPIPPPPQPPANPPAGGVARERRFRFTLGTNGNIFSRMEGYRNLRIDEDAQGNITINADRV